MSTRDTTVSPNYVLFTPDDHIKYMDTAVQVFYILLLLFKSNTIMAVLSNLPSFKSLPTTLITAFSLKTMAPSCLYLNTAPK